MTMTKRTDCHCPKNIDPADYRYEREMLTQVPNDLISMAAASGCVGLIDKLREEIKENLAWYDREGFHGNFRSKRTCDHCGAWFIYGAAFRHEPTGKIIVVGWICAEETMNVPDRAALNDKRLRQRVASMRNTIKEKSAIARRKREAFEVYPDLKQAFETDHYIVRDIAERFERCGKLSEAQVNLVFKLQKEAAERAANPKVEIQWQPVTEGRRQVTGTILSTKWQDSMYGGSLKMLVHLDGDQKVWGTVPDSLSWTEDNEHGLSQARSKEDYRGLRVTFTARFEQKRGEPCFGYFKRPTKVSVLSESDEAVAA